MIPASPDEEPTARYVPAQDSTQEGAAELSPTMTARGNRTMECMPVIAERELGDFVLLEELGRGGMGVVFKAREKKLDRIVALKLIIQGPLANSEDLARFRIEAEAAARLQHPNIVTVLGFGEINGQYYYSMEYVEGPSLAKVLADGPLPTKKAARYVMQTARAIHYAHSRQILHRDLKPSNILLDANDEPHVADFGLAKKLGGDSGQTRTGAVLGTPSYMAPEQAAGKTNELGPTTDVYGLGAVLYELITGKPLFRAHTPLDTIQQVIEQDPIPPRQLNPMVERDIEIICLKCVHKDPKQRYASAAELADDLQRFLAGEPISARSLGVFDHLTRALDRSHHAKAFRSWSQMLVWIAVIMFCAHLAKFLLTQTGYIRGVHWLVRGVQFALILVVFWCYRSRTFLPTNWAERQLWAIWIAYFLAYMVTVVVVRELMGDRWDELTLYPFSAVLSGMAFFAMGSSYWGRCYLFGLAFFVLAGLMPLWLDWAPLGLGTLWCITLLSIAFHVRNVGKNESR
ncbi:MAG: hypothetical protein KatS3mg105_1159 [Gemmatales bacterium]|nr:MAG: hypothetical protein KatS3mg105_1159 [Gemmatales bacterium]